MCFHISIILYCVNADKDYKSKCTNVLETLKIKLKIMFILSNYESCNFVSLWLSHMNHELKAFEKIKFNIILCVPIKGMIWFFCRTFWLIESQIVNLSLIIQLIGHNLCFKILKFCNVVIALNIYVSKTFPKI